MANTASLDLPLVQAAQAQKHVTVNEALALIDALTQPVLASATLADPPVDPAEGALYAVPADATGVWAGQGGLLALFLNGGWRMITPRLGWRAWVSDAGAEARFDGTDWRIGAVAVGALGAASLVGVTEVEHDIAPGSANTTALVIPASTLVFGVTARVVTAITGGLSTWKLGVSGAGNRYGSGLGLAAGSWAQGLTGQPQAYYSDTPIQIAGEGGDLADGKIRLALHTYQLTLPR